MKYWNQSISTLWGVVLTKIDIFHMNFYSMHNFQYQVISNVKERDRDKDKYFLKTIHIKLKLKILHILFKGWGGQVTKYIKFKHLLCYG